MKNKFPNLPLLGARFLLCLGTSLLALLLSLQFTLFNESYLISTLESTNYFSDVSHTAKTVCESLFTQANVSAGLVTQYISEDTVLDDITTTLYNRFRNAGLKTNARFAMLAVNLEDAMNAETGVIASEEQFEDFLMLQATCEASYQTMVSPPFDTALSIVLQYRSMRAVLFPAVVVLIFLAVLSLYKLSKDMKDFFNNLFRSLVPAGFACALGGLTFVLCSGFQNWMPAENIAHTAFTRWFGGLFPYLAVLGVLIGGAGIAIYLFLVQKIHLNRQSNRASSPNHKTGKEKAHPASLSSQKNSQQAAANTVSRASAAAPPPAPVQEQAPAASPSEQTPPAPSVQSAPNTPQTVFLAQNTQQPPYPPSEARQIRLPK